MSKVLSHTTTTISQYTPYDALESDNDIFNIDPFARLVLLGLSASTLDLFHLGGQLRALGGLRLDSGTFSGQGAFVNGGLAEVSGALKLGETGSDVVVLRNLPNATLSLANDSSITGPAASWVNNLGTISVAQGDAAKMDVKLIQRGVLRVEGVFGSSGAARVFGSVTGGGLATFGQAALVDANISVRSFYADSARIFGHVTCNSSIAGAEQITLVNNAILDFAFTETNAGKALNVAGRGVVNVAGTLFVGDMTLRRAVTLNAAARVNTAHYDLNNDGTFSLKPDSVTIKAVLNGTGDVAIHSQGTWTNLAQDGAKFVTAGSGGAAVFYNEGLYYDTSKVGTEFDMNVVNSGSMAAAPKEDGAIGHLTFKRSLTGRGTVLVGQGEVTVNGAVGAGQAFVFTDWDRQQNLPTAATPTLYLNDLKDFAGDIGLFDQGGYANCRLVVDTSEWAFKSVASNTFDSWLVFSNGAAETRVHLADLSAFYDPALFHASVAGHTTTITYG